MGAYVFQTAGTVARGTGNLTVTNPGSVAGRLQLGFFASGSSADTLTDPSGWTLLVKRGAYTGLYARITAGSDADASLTFANTTGHFGQICEFSGDVYPTIGSIVHGTPATNFTSSASVPVIPDITISTADCLVIIAGWHAKTATSNGSTYDNVSGFSEIAEDRPNGTQVDFVWNYQQQTTATSISGLSRSMTGTTENGNVVGLSVALLSATATAGILRQMMMQHG